jgi:predicted enzyme related to lactoylglutathione lyase
MPSTTAAIKITGIDLVGATVPDLQRSLAFYRDKLGLVPSVESADGAEFHFADGTTFGLWQPPADFGIGHHFSLMFTVEDVAAARAHLRERGTILGEPMDGATCTMSTGDDPEGHHFMIHHRKTKDEHRPPTGARTPTTVQGIDLSGFLVADPQAETTFYRDILGFEATSIDEQGRGAEFSFADGSSFGVWRTPEGTKGGFTMFAVDDAKAKVDEMRARGVTLEDVMETPVCLMSFCEDPDGHAVIIHQRKTR